MDIFIAWSGDTASAAARALRDWLPKVVPSCHPFYSELDLEAGRPWLPQLDAALNNAEIAIVCVTPESATSAWVNFEAGRLRGLDRRVVPYLIGAGIDDLRQAPLGTLQALLNDQDGTRTLIGLISESFEDRGRRTVFSLFEAEWPRLRAAFDSLAQAPSRPAREKTPQEQYTQQLQALVETISRAMVPAQLPYPAAEAWYMGESREAERHRDFYRRGLVASLRERHELSEELELSLQSFAERNWSSSRDDPKVEGFADFLASSRPAEE